MDMLQEETAKRVNPTSISIAAMDHPFFLTLARYNSFYFGPKRALIDIVVDGQFCCIPFCLNIDVMINFFKKWQGINPNMRSQGILIFICLLAIAITLILLYWDISFVDIQQKRDNVASKDKRAMMRLILAISVAVVSFSFYVDVIFCTQIGIAP